ncbi:LLM class flavin-dependent oxidoreductase [Kineococcus sp. SYSU DK018]|uniref:LLM class flavin-dependent oxidoreductase n=1 Tax=Kineococcus sp. SYSU DK018 TaxID=3383139 RepID=UPI003D7E72CA
MTPALSAVVLNDHAPARFTAAVREVEAAGLRTAFTYDHLSWRDMREGPWFNAVPLLAAAGAATSTVRLGTLVASPNFRHPVTFASEVMTLDHVCGGRFELGVGAGTSAHDAAVLGAGALTPGQRQRRFEEWAALLVRLLSQRVTDERGEFFTAHDARAVPGPLQPGGVPVTIAAAGPRGMAFAARAGDAWVTYGDPSAAGAEAVTAGYVEAAGRFERTRREVAPGRSPRRLALVGRDETAVFDRYREFAERLAAAGFDEVVVHWPRPDGRGVPAGALADVLRTHGLAVPPTAGV